MYHTAQPLILLIENCTISKRTLSLILIIKGVLIMRVPQSLLYALTNKSSEFIKHFYFSCVICFSNQLSCPFLLLTRCVFLKCDLFQKLTLDPCDLHILTHRTFSLGAGYFLQHVKYNISTGYERSSRYQIVNFNP